LTYARALAQDGAAVVIADVIEELARAAAEELAGEGHETFAVSVDVSDKQQVFAMADKIREHYGGAHILVNNAAIYHSHRRDSQMDVDIDYWRKIFSVNVEGVVLCTQAIAPMMIESGWGRVINQTSTAAYLGSGGHYAASKATVIVVTQGFARELGPSGITVNAIAPGVIDTEATRSLIAEGREAYWIEQSSLKRKAFPEDLSGTLRFLVSDDSAWMTGQTLIVDGGVLKRL
jgi:NAD(P)-dependent dehydrogenase (short-subunit alcohol dehydrogenase family)